MYYTEKHKNGERGRNMYVADILLYFYLTVKWGNSANFLVKM